jgi:uncharacterized membrane protein
MTPVAASLYDWLLFLHVLAAMVWVGGLVAVGAFATRVGRSRDRESIAGFLDGLRIIGPLVFAPAMLAVVALGIWLVLDSDAWDFGQTWVWLALTLFAIAFFVGAIFQSRAAIAAQRAAKQGDDGEAVRQLRRSSWGMRLIIVLLVVVTWDMVVKPGL